MEWSKIKSLLIVLLVLSNLLVGCLYLNLRNTKLFLPAEFYGEVRENLEAKGIKVSDNGINLKKQNLPIYTAEAAENEAVRGSLEKAAELFVGEIEEEPSFMTAPESVSVSCKGAEKSAVLTVSDNIFFECVMSETESFASAEELELLSGRKAPLDFRAEPDSAEKKAVRDFYEAFSYNRANNVAPRLGYEYCLKDVFKDGTFVITVQTLENTAVPELSMCFVFDGKDNLIYAKGAAFFGKLEKAYAEALLDGVNAVYKINREEVSEIVSESFAFSAVKIENKKYYFIPSWAVETVGRDGKKRMLVYDSIAGEPKGAYELE